MKYLFNNAHINKFKNKLLNHHSKFLIELFKKI